MHAAVCRTNYDLAQQPVEPLQGTVRANKTRLFQPGYKRLSS